MSQTRYSAYPQKMKRVDLQLEPIELVEREVFWWNVYLAVPPLISRELRSKIPWQTALDPRAKRLEKRLNWQIYLGFIETGNFDHVHSRTAGDR
jgi:hypothetical protein